MSDYEDDRPDRWWIAYLMHRNRGHTRREAEDLADEDLEALKDKRAELEGIDHHRV